LSETASAKLATPITIKFEDLRPGLGYDPRKEAANFGPVWRGGEWHLRDITNYMTTAAFSLLNHAANNREEWLSRFYEIGKEAVRPRKDGELVAYAIRSKRNDAAAVRILERAGVEVEQKRILNGGINGDFGDLVSLIRMDQPYAAFAKALLEPQKYPDLKDEKGNPIPPYDVTAHTISLLFNLETRPIFEPLKYSIFAAIEGRGVELGPRPTKIGIFRSEIPSIDEGWTRWIIDNRKGWFTREPVSNSAIRKGNILQPDPDEPPPPPPLPKPPPRPLLPTPSGTQTAPKDPIPTDRSAPPLPPISAQPRPPDLIPAYRAIIFPDQSPNSILNGYAKGTMPDEYTGGVGKEGVENLRKFVEAGGTLVFLNRASDFAIEQFNLPIRDVTKGLPRKDFYIPGSILRTELDTSNPIAKDMPKESIAWFENGPVFDVGVTPLGVSAPSGITSKDVTLTVIARYPSDPKAILLSGWALGGEKIAGKAALVQVNMGKGKIILFGFRPQYRGQSLATFPLFFNAISN
jgi:hypothetical protein